MAPEYKPLGIRDSKSKKKSTIRLSSDSRQLAQTSGQGTTQASKKPVAPKRKREDQASPEEKAAKAQRRSAILEKSKEARKRLSIGLDIGTTASAIAYAASDASADQISVLDNWDGHVEVKVPTRVAYAEENDFETDKWGFQVESGMQICNWPKLRLDENTDKADFDDPLLQQAIGQGLMHIPDGKDAPEVISDFLFGVRNHFLQHLNDTILETAVKHTAKRICVPVPTTWSLAAREATRQAVIKAGFGEDKRDEINIIDESEAAALYVIKSLEKSPEENLETGEWFMVIDNGGGTIDCVSYKIASRKPLQLEEACAGEGAKIGGTSIDRALHALMQGRFGAAFSELSISKIAATSQFMQDFESHKRRFNGQDDSKCLWLRLNMRKLDDQDKDVQANYDFVDLAAKVTSIDMQGMFEPIVDKIIEIIRGQVRRMEENNEAATGPRIIAMCGGLSCNPYVFNRVKEFVNTSFEAGSVKVLAPRQPVTAVVRGAVLAAQGRSPIVSRRCREFIGTQVHCPWDQKKHQPGDRFECPMAGPRAMNQMEWIVTKGQKLKPNMKAKVKCYHVVENARTEIKRAIIIDQMLYRCTEDVAPSRVDDPVEEIGVIRVDVTDIARQKRAKARTGYRTYPRDISIDVDIELTMSSNKGILEAVAKSGRTKVGSTTITFTPAPAWENGLVRREEDK
ncbi:hypothetical protein AYL99_02842 [Fonsecaea erecta]|uniref:Hsp70-like protein n=1 Tax=Fonsecaea erecta TaxID=1367422 RepID=A0A178ZX94_9EURO|nr:hypothetical protein AYL99_02842 [Fonsecaea erecta]OAP63615.1 hypothetical protein AYL99_02842 [Fonsecaea erecta]